MCQSGLIFDAKVSSREHSISAAAEKCQIARLAESVLEPFDFAGVEVVVRSDYIQFAVLLVRPQDWAT